MTSRYWWEGGRLSRRQVLRLMAAATTAATVLRPKVAAWSAFRAGIASEPAHGFLTAQEMAILDAAMARILPADERPGAREIGVVDYVQSLLSYMPGSDANCDRRVNAADVVAVVRWATGESGGCGAGGDVNGDASVDETDVVAAEAAVFRARPVFAGGPFSGRQPQDHSFSPIGSTPCHVCHGATSQQTGADAGTPAAAEAYPPNAFREFVPLNRLQRLGWEIRLLGVDNVPELPSDLVTSNTLLRELPEVGLRQRYRDGLAALGAGFVDLLPERQDAVLYSNGAPRAPFVALLERHAIEGALCAPEYGGNRDRLGWQLVGFDGDSQPLGYVVYDEAAPGGYRETRSDKPNSGPNVDETCAGFSEAMAEFLGLISRVTGGGPLANPYCYGVGE